MRDPLIAGVYQPALTGPFAVTNKGYAGPLQQWYESNFDPTSGYTNRAEYKGLDWNAVTSLANYFTGLGISANVKNEHGVSSLTIMDATGNYVIDKWELSVDREQPDMFENPLFLALMNNASQPTLAVSLLRQALKSNNSTDFDVVSDSGWYALVRTLFPNPAPPVAGVPGTTFNAPTVNMSAVQFLNALGPYFYGSYPGNDAAPPTGTGATLEWTAPNMVLLKQYFDAYQLGVTNFLRGKYRLRHTSNIPARWSVSVADFNVEMIYTISQLIGECTGGGFIYPLPNYLSYKILNFVPPPVAAWTPYYTWGALKEKSDAQTAVNNRVEITTEYLIDNISTLLYVHI